MPAIADCCPKLPPGLIDRFEAAEYLSVSDSTLFRMVAAGRIPEGCVVRIGTTGRTLRFDFDRLKAWKDAGCPAPKRRTG